MPSTWTDIPVQSSVDSGMYTIVNEAVENLKVLSGSSSETPVDNIYNIDARLNILEAKTNLPLGQTILAGRISTLNGKPNYIEKSTDGNYLKIVSSSSNIVSIAFASGFSTDGFPLDYLKVFSSQRNCTEWGSTTDGTYYIYVERMSSDGSPAFGQSTIAHIDDYQKSTAGIANTHVFIIPERKMYYDDGSSWVNKQRVFVGEYICTVGVVSSASIIAYAIRGEYISSVVPVVINNTYTANHNIGTDKCKIDVFARKSSSYNWSLMGGSLQHSAASAAYRYHGQSGHNRLTAIFAPPVADMIFLGSTNYCDWQSGVGSSSDSTSAEIRFIGKRIF